MRFSKLASNASSDSGASYYVTYPGFENHYFQGTGKVSIKVGICGGKKNGQKYVNGRYGQSRLHLYKYKKLIGIQRMEIIEAQVLSALVQLGYRKQHGKKEHFIIPDEKNEHLKFVNHVSQLYERFI